MTDRVHNKSITISSSLGSNPYHANKSLGFDFSFNAAAVTENVLLLRSPFIDITLFLPNNSPELYGLLLSFASFFIAAFTNVHEKK